ncbi:nitrous oxide reductase family maturation protein NosD [Cohnella sp. GCM10027633]|uniref:right-handed parallel beta-helix repeat-containing protein n=1 Tax=unclassified Cohnella TaxID=2636738 RepID=UPI00363EAAA8
MKKLITVMVLFLSFVVPAHANTFDIQEEINALGPSGGVVTIPPGEYLITVPITITKPNVILQGSGKSTVLINATNSQNTIVVYGSESTSTNIQNDLIPGGGIDNQYPVLNVTSSVGFQVNDNVKIVQSGTSTKFSYNIVKEVTGNKIVLKDNILESYQSAKLVKVNLLPDVTIKDMKIKSGDGIVGWAIYAHHTKNFTIEHVNFSKVGRNPIYVEQSYSPLITRNILFENGRAGYGDFSIGSLENFNAEISYNEITRSGAIYTRNNMFSKVIRNMSNGTGPTNADGISVVGGIGNRYEYNSILRANCYGIWLKDGAERNVISNNTFSSGITSGIYLTTAKNNIIENNVLTYNNGNGIFLEFGATGNIIRENIVRTNYSRGILVHDVNNIIDSNLSSENTMENYKFEPGNIVKNND